MPKAQEICTVNAGGQSYKIWETVECTHCTGEENTFDHCMLTVAENSTGAKSVSDLKLKPGDTATVSLAGQQIMQGMVYLRQAAFDANTHAVQIGICSSAYSTVVSTVDTKPGQYVKQTVQQIGSACFGKIGINFKVDGSPAGADTVFARVSEHLGETRFAFIERLCRMRNLYLSDDGNNGIVAFRGPTSGGGLVLKEGYNIKRARLLLKNQESVSHIDVLGSDHNNESGDDNRATKGSTTADPTVNRPLKIAAEHTGTDAEMQMRADKEKGFIVYQTVDGDITTQGWLCPDGSLWWNHLRGLVVLDSPMLIPPRTSPNYFIKGITHRQSSQEGTTTIVSITDRNAFGGPVDVGA